MDNYDPNIRFAIHTVQVTFQSFRFTRTLSVKVRGNVKGFSILESARDSALNDLMDELDEKGCVVFSHEGDSLTIDKESQEADWDEFEKMIVKVEIVGFTAENRA